MVLAMASVICPISTSSAGWIDAFLTRSFTALVMSAANFTTLNGRPL